MVAGHLLSSVNDATRRQAPKEAMDQIGSVLPRIIEALANAPLQGDVMLSKLDVSDGFWRMVCEEGEEWNFAHVLLSKPGQDLEIVAPSVLQMGWVLSPPFFCAASETARDVAALYAAEPLGSLPQHPLEDMMMPSEEDELFWLPEEKYMSGKGAGSFLHLLGVYVDDFIQMAQTKDEETLRHLSRALLHGIHSVFPPPDVTGHNGADPVSVKNS